MLLARQQNYRSAISEDFAEIEGLAATIFGAYIGLLMQDLAHPDVSLPSDAVKQLIGVLKRLMER